MGMIALTATLIINKGGKMKQTAVEWLLQRFEDGDMYNVEDAQFIKHQALAMEKEQIEDAWSAGKKNPFIVQHSECCENNGKQYYNETYKGGQQ